MTATRLVVHRDEQCARTQAPRRSGGNAEADSATSGGNYRKQVGTHKGGYFSFPAVVGLSLRRSRSVH